MSTIMMQCPRDFVLRTTTGHTVRFEAGKPTPVPEAIYAEALARNIVPVKGPIDTDSPATGNTRVSLHGPLRDALLYNAIHALVQRNQPEDFDGGGQPKPSSIKDFCGVPISAQERTKYWSNYRELMGNNVELPSHPNVNLVLELQSISSRKQLLEFAAEHEIDLAKPEGKTPADLKALLLGLLVNHKQAPAQEPSNSTLVEP